MSVVWSTYLVASNVDDLVRVMVVLVILLMMRVMGVLVVLVVLVSSLDTAAVWAATRGSLALDGGEITRRRWQQYFGGGGSVSTGLRHKSIVYRSSGALGFAQTVPVWDGGGWLGELLLFSSTAVSPHWLINLWWWRRFFGWCLCVTCFFGCKTSELLVLMMMMMMFCSC